MRIRHFLVAAVAGTGAVLGAGGPVVAAATPAVTCVRSRSGLAVARVTGGVAGVEGSTTVKKVRYRSVAVSDAAGVAVLAGLPRREGVGAGAAQGQGEGVGAHPRAWSG